MNAQTEHGPGSEPGQVPATSSTRARLTWLTAGLIAAEAAVLLAGAVFLVVELLRNTPDSLPGAISLAVMTFALSAGLAACAAGVLGHRTWVRGPVVTWQLIQGGVAMRLTTAAAWWFGLPLLMVALIIGVAIAGPWVLGDRSRASDAD